jgi:hypothetical protein
VRFFVRPFTEMLSGKGLICDGLEDGTQLEAWMVPIWRFRCCIVAAGWVSRVRRLLSFMHTFVLRSLTPNEWFIICLNRDVQGGSLRQTMWRTLPFLLTLCVVRDGDGEAQYTPHYLERKRICRSWRSYHRKFCLPTTCAGPNLDPQHLQWGFPGRDDHGLEI